MIRNYESSDFTSCVEIVNKVWDFDTRFKPSQLANLFKKVYVGGSLSGSNYAYIIEDNHRVKGFLFGKLGDKKLIKTPCSGVLGQIQFLFSLLFMTGVTFKRKLNYLRIIGEHDQNRRTIEPSRDDEVNLFAVDPDAQGKGYGKILMNQFIETGRKLKRERITLETDKECNYKFYDYLGFKIKGEFYSPLQKEYSGKSGESYVYELTIGEKV